MHSTTPTTATTTTANAAAASKQQTQSSFATKMAIFLPVLGRILGTWFFIYWFLGSILSYTFLVALMLAIWYFKNSAIDREAVSYLLPVDRPFVIAKRCGNADAPENTIGAVREAVAQGAKAVHFDIEFTVDDIAVVFHDKTLERCTNGTGKLNEVTFKFLEMLDASLNHTFGLKYPNEKIQSLENMVLECIRHNLIMVIEFKDSHMKAIRAIKMIFEKHPNVYKDIIIVSDNPVLLYRMRRSIPMAICGLIHRTYQFSRTPEGHLVTKGYYLDYLFFLLCDWLVDYAYKTWAWFFCGYSFVLLHHKDVSISLMEYYRDIGITTIVWTVNTKVEKEFYLDIMNCSVLSDTMAETLTLNKRVTHRSLGLLDAAKLRSSEFVAKPKSSEMSAEAEKVDANSNNRWKDVGRMTSQTTGSQQSFHKPQMGKVDDRSATLATEAAISYNTLHAKSDSKKYN